MRAAAAIRAARDDSLRRERRIQPIDTAKRVALPIVETHVPGDGFGVMFASLAVAKPTRWSAQDATGTDRLPRADGELEPSIFERPRKKQAQPVLWNSVFCCIEHKRVFHAIIVPAQPLDGSSKLQSLVKIPKPSHIFYQKSIGAKRYDQAHKI